ncbi:uncharacterized protein B0I36DRAFT_115113 [Microdochium trichocladiopsis]|uniref:Uncharacterized protein n=1 Tax=Microdochium trichocladiopsis TaxID=1682393 RepID=A0A9P8Y8Y3_9PEZI|nr:uncharacterized protein B0I36DRAFT_115113 [Microdochium trichocladiopsis]KAH7030870.1 hypothetical protein B0I36DRAFT_115113 [Microdochium trichocladiopsis]
MKALGSLIVGTYTSLCTSLSQCLPSNHQPQDQRLPRESEKGFGIIDEQPGRVLPLAARANASRTRAANKKDRAPKRRKPSTNSIFSTRQRLLSNASSTTRRRPQISAPTNFQHVYSGSFHFPEPTVAPIKSRRRSFRPLELSIYLKDNRLSPLLPPFEGPEPPVTPPHRMIPQPDADTSDSLQSLARSRSYSSTSFHVPRRAISGGSVFESPRSEHSQPHSTSSPPGVTRKRAYTSPEAPPAMMEDLVERVAQAMLERDELQHKINDVIERQSLYTISRPATPHDMQDMEPMPEVPALPPNAPSFSERLHFDRTPTTPVPPTPLGARPSSSPQRLETIPPPPPLPLRLRPPLRKKKSFSRVSNWLVFYNSESKERQLSLDSVTNFPKPITDNDGFYEVAQPPARPSRRSSFDSVSSASDWSVEEEQTVPTSWSPASDMTIKAVAPMQTGVGFAPSSGSHSLRPSRAFVFPSVPRQTLRRQARDSAMNVPHTVGVAV